MSVILNPVSGPVKRSYRSPLREEAAKRTRAQIRDVARSLFSAQGYATTTMRQIAEQAGVAERTVYAVFPTKLALFVEVVGVALAGDDRPLPLAARPEFQATLHERDGELALQMVVTAVSAVLERAGALIMAGYESRGADEGMRDAASQGEAARARDLRLVADALYGHGVLHEDLDPEQATDVLLSLLSPQVHQMLRRDTGRSLEQYRAFLLATLRRCLLRPPSEADADTALLLREGQDRFGERSTPGCLRS
jgi:AcrR family transcriptional regulator